MIDPDEIGCLSWRQSIAAQLYEIADSWSRDDLDECGLNDVLFLVCERISARRGKLNAAFKQREDKWA